MAQPEPVVGAPGTVVVPLDGSDVAARAVARRRRPRARVSAPSSCSSRHPDHPRRPYGPARLARRGGRLRERTPREDRVPGRAPRRRRHPARSPGALPTRPSAWRRTAAVRSAPRSSGSVARTSSATPNARSSSSGRTSTARRPGTDSPMIVCHDGSHASAAIVPVAAAWAKALGTLRGGRPRVPPARRRERAGSRPRRSTRSSAILRETLDDVDVRVYRDSYPVGVILELARTLPASLVALSTHGRTGLARITLGSVAASLTHASPCPVLLTARRRTSRELRRERRWWTSSRSASRTSWRRNLRVDLVDRPRRTSARSPRPARRDRRGRARPSPPPGSSQAGLGARRNSTFANSTGAAARCQMRAIFIRAYERSVPLTSPWACTTTSWAISASHTIAAPSTGLPPIDGPLQAGSASSASVQPAGSPRDEGPELVRPDVL